ncbi:alpha-galactosidase [Vibrio sp. JPW-9-11-11]|uniref:putative Ig domain-containing protein n=1 Tax=Vibrio sp. JPW-9-11-11 TaxID=1416532 RepID=UPI001592F049|nr:putative Ig domain-containing protein [Vibrio sp. JPW-9-11-11]NVD06463.1 alpha-galactosidase [Vibrio sp. JPW-9-11-11]
MSYCPIRTPKPSKAPRINGAKTVGYYPNHPFQHKVAASGAKPIVYFADDLPAGLTLNSNTGVLSGTVQTPGKYEIQLTVRNTFGQDTKTLRLCIGDQICLTPPMGWNSWYCHSELISEDAIKQTAIAFIEKGLIDYGWSYINIDDCWQGERCPSTLALQANERFNDMRGMCQFVKSLGLKPGIYTTPWQATYAGFIGSSAPNVQGRYQDYYLVEQDREQYHQFFGRYPSINTNGLNQVGEWFFDRDVQQFADWGFEFIKLDWKPNDVPTAMRMWRDTQSTRANIVVSLSNDAPFAHAAELAKWCHCWRTTGDIHDCWEIVSKIGFSQAPWQALSAPGRYPDPDMLQIGRIGVPNRKNTQFNPTRLSYEEQYAQVSLWVLLSAPLMLSCDIEQLDEFTLNLITNSEVIDINQDPLVSPARRFCLENDVELWIKDLENGDIAIGIFNRSDIDRTLNFDLSRYIDFANVQLRDVWRHQYVDINETKVLIHLHPHSAELLRAESSINKHS